MHANPHLRSENPCSSSPHQLTREAFIRYLRKGTRPELSLKAASNQHSTTHYIWRTRGDNKVRPEHAANNGKIFAWDNPPPTGHPGEAFGCRCLAEAYYGGSSTINDPPIEPVYPELIFLPLLRFGGITATLLRQVLGVNDETLNGVQASNLKRFDQKLPKDVGDIQILSKDNGQRVFYADVPARNIPGSYARYEKVVDKAGNTTSYTKTTYAPDGSIVHIKLNDEEEMESRAQLLESLLQYSAPIEQIMEKLKRFLWDSKTVLVTITRKNIIRLLEDYCAGGLEAGRVEEWANALEAREDIAFEDGHEGALQEAIYQLANPLLTAHLTTRLAQQIIKNLRCDL